MASARYIITQALRRIRVVGIIDTPAAEEMAHSLNALNDLLAAYEADGLTTARVVIRGNVTNGSTTVTDLDNATNLFTTDDLVAGMEVFGAGVAGQVRSITSKGEIELTEAATASGTGVDLTFSAIPMDDSFTEAVTSILAVRLAEDYGASIGPILARDAKRGQAQIDGAFFKVPKSTFDAALTSMPSHRDWDDLGNG